MKHVTVPEDVHIVDREGKPVLAVNGPEDKEPKPFIVTHERFVMDHICDSPHIVNGGVKALRRARKLADLFEGCKPGDVIPIEDDDFEAAIAALSNIVWAQSFARFATQMLPHLEAWEAAKGQDIAWQRAQRRKHLTNQNAESDDAA